MKGLQMTKKKKSLTQFYNDEIYAKTKKYQKIYGFEIGTGSHDAWNNEADAFKHTFMQADLSLKLNVGLSKLAGDYHELEGELNHQPKGEKNMALWNNEIGREISREIRKEYNRIEVIKHINSGKMDDIIADKIMKRMKKGELITHPSDPRKYRTPAQKFSDEIKSRYHQMQEERKRKYPVFRKSNTSQSNSSGKGRCLVGSRLTAIPHFASVFSTHCKTAPASARRRWVTINGNHVFIED